MGHLKKPKNISNLVSDFAAGISFTLNLHKGAKLSVQGFPLPTGVSVTSSNAKVCDVSVKNGVVSLSALANGTTILTASVLGIPVSGKVTVKVW